MERRKVSTAYNEFIAEIDAVLRLDAHNQRRFRGGPGRPNATSLTLGQMHLMTEGIFSRAFSHYELFLEEIFILYTRKKPTRGGNTVRSYIVPKDGVHAREMLKSSMTFLEWNSTETVIKRCETYLEDGNPIKLSMTTHSATLQRMRVIRNAIAHRSQEAQSRYNAVVRQELRAAPLRPLPPGAFLLTADPAALPNYFLITYLDVLKRVASIATA